MPDQSSQAINAALREAIGTFDVADAAGINRALRQAAGIDQPPASSAGRRLTSVDYAERDHEPEPGLFSLGAWQRWAYSPRVQALLDGQGRLPGERGYAGPWHTQDGGPDNLDAVIARKQRWLHQQARAREQEVAGHER